jgi:hypothetical protein
LANLNIWLFDAHSSLQWLSTGTAVLRRDHPPLIGLGETINRNDTDTGLIVATISGTKTDTPTSLRVTRLEITFTNVDQKDSTYPKRHVICSVCLHTRLGFNGILTRQHFDKCMALVLVDNA